MRILIVSGLYDPYIKGGAEVMAATLARGMVQGGHFVGVATTHEGNGILTENRDGVEIRRYGIKNSYWHFTHDKASAIKRMLWHWRDMFNAQAGLDIKDAVESLRPDVAICHNLTGFSVSAWKVLSDLGVPVVQVLHDYYTLCPRSTLFKKGRNCQTRCLSCRAFRVGHSAASTAVTGVIAVSRAMLGLHEQYGMFTSVPIKRVIYNARAMDIPERIRHPGDGLVFGFIGALVPEKGVGLLIDAFKQFFAEFPQARLLVAGEGEANYVTSLKQSVAALPVEFVGRVNASDFYARLAVSIVPSVWNDPLPGVVFEALAHGVPVVGARQGGIPEMVRHNENGLIFSTDNVGGLVDVLRQLASNPDLVNRLSIGARPSVAAFMDEERMLREHEEVYVAVSSVVANEKPAC